MNKNLVYLVQTDTTVGFLSFDDKKLNSVKKRASNQKVLKALSSFKKLKENTRVPNKFKKLIRKSKKTSFIYPNNNSYRIIDNSSEHYNFIDKFDFMYSSSANENKKKFDEEFSKNNADVIVFNQSDFKETEASDIFKVSNHKIKRIR